MRPDERDTWTLYMVAAILGGLAVFIAWRAGVDHGRSGLPLVIATVREPSLRDLDEELEER